VCNFGLLAGFSEGYKEAFSSGDMEPWAFRGGLQSELQVCIAFKPDAPFTRTRRPADKIACLFNSAQRAHSEMDEQVESI